MGIQHPSDELYALPAHYHWVFCDEALLRGISVGRPMARGIGGGTLRLLLRICSVAKLTWPLLWLVGFVELGKLLCRQWLTVLKQRQKPDSLPRYFIVGFPAGSEAELLARYCNDQHEKVGRLDQLDIAPMAGWYQVGIWQAISSYMRTMSVARKAIAAIPPSLSMWRIEFLTFVGIRAGGYAYTRAWFKGTNEKLRGQLKEIAFLVGDTAAFAAADLGLPTCYIQHGLMFYTKLFPRFSRVEALTMDEAAFMRECLPEADVTVRELPYTVLQPSQLDKSILVASIYGSADYMATITSFISWAASKDLPIRVRHHPRENRGFWSEYEETGTVIADDKDKHFWQAIERIRPRLVVSWFSTTLAEALANGIVPVTVCVDDDRNVVDTVYPIFRRCLRWPMDSECIAQLMEDDEHYANVVARLSEGFREHCG